MSIDIETYKKITGDADLLEKLEDLWKEDASSDHLAQVIEDAGIDVEAGQVEEFLAQNQAKRAAAIALDEVDEEQLKKVAGGSSEGEDYDFSCDDSYFCHQNVYEQCTENLMVACDAYTALSL